MRDFKSRLHKIFPHPVSPTFSVVSATGTSNDPKFIISVEVSGFSTQAKARTKKQAKEDASNKMLNILFGKR